MKITTRKDILSILLIMAAIFAAMFPCKAFAESTSLDTGIEGLYAEYDGGSWTSSGNMITGSATGTAEDIWDYAKSSSGTLVLKNSLSEDAVLSFSYSVTLSQGGKVTIDDAEVLESGSFSKRLAPNETVVITIFSGDPGARTSSAELKGITFTKKVHANVTFMPSGSGGYYTVDGEVVTEKIVIEKDAEDGFDLQAFPSEGYKLLGWYSDSIGGYLGDSAAFTAYFDRDQTVYPVFSDEDLPIWQAGVYRSSDLNDAVLYAAENEIGTIVLASSGTIPAGTYTIPSGHTLLIPYDNAGTVNRETPDIYKALDAFAPYPFRTLRMAGGTVINIEGALNVNGKINSDNTGYTGVTSGPYGYISMEEGSSINLSSGASLYCWGYIAGEGSITAARGSSVYEPFEIADLRGGTATSAMNNNAARVLPFQQYYIQNIEVLTVYEYGSRGLAVGSTTIDGDVAVPTLNFAGSEDGSLFRLSAGSSFSKRYDPKDDRVYYEIDGDASLSPVSIKAYINVYSDKYTLPLMENTTVIIKSGTVTLDQDLCLLPGNETIIERGSALRVSSGNKLYIYDRDDYMGKSFLFEGADMMPSFYQPSRDPSDIFDESKMADALIDVCGRLEAEGSVFTTESGANITSSNGLGRVSFISAPLDQELTYQAVQTGTEVEYKAVQAVAPMLKNGVFGQEDGYTLTAGSEEGSYFSYCKKEDKWHMGDPCQDAAITVIPYPQDAFTEWTDYVAHERTVNVFYDIPCRAGYLKDGKYVKLEPRKEADGSYSFDAPEGVDELILVILGDVNLDSRISNADSTKLKASVKGMTTLDLVQEFAADVNGDKKISNADSTKLKAVVKGMTTLGW